MDDKYILKVDIAFNRDLVSQFLFEKNISYSEVKRLDILIYPILIINSEPNIFSNNKLFEEWNENEDFENISFILPVENVEDIRFIKQNISVLRKSILVELLMIMK